jgi:1-deoxy-D-xylulose-5-phosphate reductoisomerase
MRQRIVVLGSTGSIGRSTLEVLEALGNIEVVGLAARRDVEAMVAQAQHHRPRVIGMSDPVAAAAVRERLGPTIEVLEGPDALVQLATIAAVDLVFVCVVGVVGLVPTLEALRSGHDVALANKETLVAGGHLVMDALRRSGRRLLPIDSEHVAIRQCLNGESTDTVRRVLLTGSGGPFLHRTLSSLAYVRPDEAIAHPTWKMGKKISVDSATLMNKGFEVIEAYHLFDLDPSRIAVVLHPQSIVHSMVEFVDGTVKAQLAPPDMRLVIAYAMAAPSRIESPVQLDWTQLSLTFTHPDPARYPCLGYAYDALATGGTMPAVLNAANEVAVESFLAGRIGFLEIAQLVRHTMDAHRVVYSPRVEEVLAADTWAREQALARPLR